MKRKTTPTGVGLVVIVTTVLGWIGCDSLSKVADSFVDVLSKAREVAKPTLGQTNTTPPATGIQPQSNPFSPSGPYSNQGYASQPAYVNPGQASAQNAPTNSINASAATVNSSPLITIGSFNIQVFGQSKLRDPGVMSHLVDIARKFDILAIQEIRDEDQTALPTFVRMINQFGEDYSYLVGTREGADDQQGAVRVHL